MQSFSIPIILFIVLKVSLINGREPQPVPAVVQHHAVTAREGEVVRLPCEVDKAVCGGFHSIKWYNNSNKRIFIFSESPRVSRPEGGVLTERIDFHYLENNSTSLLEISPLRLEDEGLYKCEITYLAVQEACSVVQFVNLTTQAIPGLPQLTFEDGSRIDDTSIIGPFDEDSLVTVSCMSDRGKPVPDITWWNGSHSISGDYRSSMNDDGTGTGINTLTWPISRGDLGMTLTCKVINDAIKTPHTTSITLDVNVAPEKVTARKKKKSVNEGEVVELDCLGENAKPPSQIVWYNGSIPVVNADTSVNIQEASNETKQMDGTYNSYSRLTFRSTKWENGLTFSCSVINDVIVNRDGDPVTRDLVMDVRFVPSVRVSPENITVNESMDVLIFCQYSANPKELTHVMWYLDGVQVDVSGNADKYGNGDIKHPSLLVKNTSASDMGNYTCRVANEIGVSEVTNYAYVNVQVRPTVQVVMDPPGAVSESDQVNVTLICDAVQANPAELQRVRWYLDGNMLKELPECDGNSTLYDSDSGLCDIDPTRLLLENVRRDFQGTYSCEGMNEAGWGPRSLPAELIIHYPPGRSAISYQPAQVIKGEPLTLTCEVDDPGRPEATTYRWTRGNHSVPNNGPVMRVDSVSLETEADFTCLPINSEGEGESQGIVRIDVLAKPTFITRLPPYHGELMNAEKVHLSCRVECSPLCNITWYKDDSLIYNDSYYIITNTVLPPDPSSGDLESMLSVLSWKMSEWPGGELHREEDNANYTCTSSDNGAGSAVTSHTYFRVEYPPEKIFVSPETIPVIENEIPEKIECKGFSYPEPTYYWHHGTELVSTSSVLNLGPVDRYMSGKYNCRAQNRHGNLSTTANLDVWYRPECKIDRVDDSNNDEGKILLICRADANPTDVTFRWRTCNDTLIPLEDSSDPLQSELMLDASVASLGTYYCYVNNSVGDAIPCEIDITGIVGSPQKLNDKMTLLSKKGYYNKKYLYPKMDYDDLEIIAIDSIEYNEVLQDHDGGHYF